MAPCTGLHGRQRPTKTRLWPVSRRFAAAVPDLPGCCVVVPGNRRTWTRASRSLCQACSRYCTSQTEPQAHSMGRSGSFAVAEGSVAGEAGSSRGPSSPGSVGEAASSTDSDCRDSRRSTHFGTSSTSQWTPYFAGLDLVAARLAPERSDFPDACAAVCSLPTARPPGRPTHGSSSDGGVKRTRGGACPPLGPASVHGLIAARSTDWSAACLRGDTSCQLAAGFRCYLSALGDVRKQGKHLQRLQAHLGHGLGAASQESASVSGARSAKHLAPNAGHD